MRVGVRSLWLSSILMVAGCDPTSSTSSNSQDAGDAGDASTSVALADLAADPARYVGRTLRVVGTPASVTSCTASACIDPAIACNACNLHLDLHPGAGGYAPGIPVSPSARFVITTIAFAPTPPATAPEWALPTTLGCVGSEHGFSCAPSLPRAILAMTGTLSASGGGYAFAVDALELDPAAPQSESCGGSVATCTRTVSTVPYGLDGGVGDGG